jgi:glycosyltransferase involved in cell wall biosynthesis
MSINPSNHYGCRESEPANFVNGLLSLFQPADRGSARAELDLPQDRHLLFTSANRILSNRFKDWATLRAAAAILAERLPEEPVTFVVLGERGAEERIGRVEIRFVPYEPDSALVALYYRAADIFLHAARSENFPTTVLEALACGTPVIATAVGGVPEQIRDLADPRVGEAATGVLVPPRDAEAMAHWIKALLADPILRSRLGRNARQDAEARFSFDHMLAAYLRYYEDAIDRFSLFERGPTA